MLGSLGTINLLPFLAAFGDDFSAKAPPWVLRRSAARDLSVKIGLPSTNQHWTTINWKISTIAIRWTRFDNASAPPLPLRQSATAGVLGQITNMSATMQSQSLLPRMQFFEMSKFDAAKALEIYKRAGQQAEILAEFYEFCKALELARNFQFPTLRQPPPSFLATMEEYIKELPRVGSASSKNLEFEEKNLLTYKEEDAPPETQEPAATKEEKQPDPEPEEQPPEPTPEPELEPEPPATTGDLLGLEEEINPVAAEIDQNNELALAIMQPGDGSKPLTCMDLLAGGSSGWELTRVTTPSNNTNHVGESKLAGGFDKLLLNSLYEDRARQQQIAFTRILWWCRNCCQSFQQE